MHQLTLSISDNAYIDLKNIINKNPNIKVEKDIYKPSKDSFDYVSDEKMEELKQISTLYKNGNSQDFEEYPL